jgi:hypothetical protein
MRNRSTQETNEAEWQIGGSDERQINFRRNRATNPNNPDARPKSDGGVEADAKEHASIKSHAAQPQNQNLLQKRRVDCLTIRTWLGNAPAFQQDGSECSK